MNTIFRHSVKSGDLEIFRNLTSQFITLDFYKNCSFFSDPNLSRACSQRLQGHIYSQTNIRGFVCLKNNKPYLILMPYALLRKFGIGKPQALFMACLFGCNLFRISVLRTLRATFSILRSRKQIQLDSKKQNIFLFGVTEESLNKLPNDRGAHTIETWLRENYLSPESVLYHSVDSKHLRNSEWRRYVKLFLPANTSKQIFFVFLKFTVELLKCLTSFVLGNWRPIFMLDDWLIAQAFKTKSDPVVHDKYIFPFQGTQYRPYWTYAAAKAGAIIVQYNYSANTVPSLNGVYEDRDALNTASWDEIIPFNQDVGKEVMKKLRSGPKRPKVIMASSTFFNDESSIMLPEFNQPTISVFDVQPLEEKHHVGWMDFHEYMETDDLDPCFLQKKFILDLVTVASDIGMRVLLKPKRYDDRVIPSYLSLLEKLASENRISILDCRISPSRLVEATDCCVALPFSSPGYLNDYNKNICFYDVANKFSRGHEAALSSKLVSDLDDLRQWLAQVLRGLKLTNQKSTFNV